MNMLAVLLPLLCFAALLRRDDPRGSFILSAVATGAFVALSTEILSLFHLIGRGPLIVCWVLYLAALIAWRYRRRPDGGNAPCPPLTPAQKLLLALVAVMVALTGITAVVAAPNNFDSLTYHLPRMMHWIQNRSVAHYPTHIDRQLFMAPFSEYAIMHLQLLAGGDRFANGVQWFSQIGCAVAVSLVARTVGGSINSQMIAAALAVSLPMGLLQSTSTQTDYVVSLWLACLVYYVVRAKTSPDARNALLAGLCLALATFSKGTAYLAAVPFMLLYLRYQVAAGVKAAGMNCLVIALALLAINGSLYARNFHLFGNPLSPPGHDITCKRVDPASVVSGITKNLALQLTTGSQEANRALLALTAGIHRALGVDVNDPDLTEGRGFIMLPPAVLHSEDFAPNPLHMALMLAAPAVLIIRRRSCSRDTILLAAAAAGCFVVLCAGIRWNLFISRIFLPAFITAAPVTALLFDSVRLQRLSTACAILLLLLSFPVLADNTMRPLVGPKSVFTTERTDQYFMVNPQAKPYFLATAGMIQGQPNTNIGILDRDGNMWEYLLWVLLQGQERGYRIEHVNVENPSGMIKLRDFTSWFPVHI